MKEKHVEIIVPCYNEQECIRPLYHELYKVFEGMENVMFSVFFIDDGSSDTTLDEIRGLAAEFGSHVIRYISFARNFGKEAAIYAGLKNCRGDYIVLMDADLQHPPGLLADMLAEMEKGHDCCGARRVTRKGEPMFRSLFSRMFYTVINRITSMKLVPGGSDFRMMTKQMADAAVSLTERERFTKGILSWVGFDTVWIGYENVKRAAGETKWSFFGLARYAWSGFLSFATAPLRAAVYFGMVIVLADFLYAAWIFIGALSGNSPRTGYASMIILILFLGGVIITILGIIGEYLARIYIELKHRPVYISKESNVTLDEMHVK